jgi:ketosteroid isomerase-like protein
MTVREIEDLVRSLYGALEAGDGAAIEELLAPEFEGGFADGMPLGLGGRRSGAVAMRDQGWWAIGRSFAARAEPQEWIRCEDGRLLVLGRYSGHGRRGGGVLDAAFAHLWSASGGRLSALVHFTDTARWQQAAGPEPTI